MQGKDVELARIIDYLNSKTLPADEIQARNIRAISDQYFLDEHGLS